MHDEACWLAVYLSSLSPANTQNWSPAKEGPSLISGRRRDIRETLAMGDQLDSFFVSGSRSVFCQAVIYIYRVKIKLDYRWEGREGFNIQKYKSSWIICRLLVNTYRTSHIGTFLSEFKPSPNNNLPRKYLVTSAHWCNHLSFDSKYFPFHLLFPFHISVPNISNRNISYFEEQLLKFPFIEPCWICQA